MRPIWLAVAAFALASCDLAGSPAWVGRYDCTGTWDLAGPLAGGRTAGDAVADLLTEQLVSVLGVPSVLEDEVCEILDAAVRPSVKFVVDPNAPPELAPGGSVHDALAMALAQVKVESELTLEEDLLPGHMKGEEVFTTFAFEHGGQIFRLDAAELSRSGVVVASDWKGKGKGSDRLEVEQHSVEIRFGELVRRVADLAVDAAGQTELGAEVQAAVRCDAIAARIVGEGEGLTIAVGDFSQTLGLQQLKDACAQALPKIGERVLGLIKVDSTLEVGGEAQLDVAASELRSAEGFGGIVAAAPRPLAPRLSVSFTAKRK